MTKKFVAEGATVYYINHNCVDEPVRVATVETVHPDGGSVDLVDEVLGDVTVDVDDVFETAASAAARI